MAKENRDWSYRLSTNRGSPLTEGVRHESDFRAIRVDYREQNTLGRTGRFRKFLKRAGSHKHHAQADHENARARRWGSGRKVVDIRSRATATGVRTFQSVRRHPLLFARVLEGVPGSLCANTTTTL